MTPQHEEQTSPGAVSGEKSKKRKVKIAAAEPLFKAAQGSEQDMAARILPGMIGRYKYIVPEKQWVRWDGERWVDDTLVMYGRRSAAGWRPCR